MTATSISTRSHTLWADINSDSEDEGDALFGPLSMVDDASYREKPVPELEDSRDGLNKQLRSTNTLCTQAAPSASSQPLDFSFLMMPKRHDATATPRTSSSEWQPKNQTPEFIPTLSMTCPLVGMFRSETSQLPAPTSPLVVPCRGYADSVVSEATSDIGSVSRRRRRGCRSGMALRSKRKKLDVSAEVEAKANEDLADKVCDATRARSEKRELSSIPSVAESPERRVRLAIVFGGNGEAVKCRTDSALSTEAETCASTESLATADDVLY